MNLRLALRTLLKTPYVTAVGVLSLALGIGATTAIFSLYYQVLLRPLSVQQPGELVNLLAPGYKLGNESCGAAGGCEAVFSYPMFRDLEKQQTSFAGIAGHVSFEANLAASGTTISGRGMMVSGSYFPLLGLQPALGRLLGPEDDGAPGAAPFAVLTYDYWRTRFAENPGVLNQTLIVNGHTFTIVGVAPRAFTGTTLQVRAQVFVPITMRELVQPSNATGNGPATVFERRRAHWIYLFARLKPGVSREAAQSSINALFHQIITEVEAPTLGDRNAPNLERFKARKILLVDGSRGQSVLPQNARAPLSLLFAVTGMVLVVACANLANLFLARSSERAGEMAIRTSIGANRRQLITQLLTEACLLAAWGGVGALAVARWTLDLILAIAPETSDTLKPGLNGPEFLFIGGVTLAAGIAFGLIPALQTTRSEFLSLLKARAGRSSGSRSMSRFRSALAAFQIALSLALLISAGLFLRSLVNLSRVELGVHPENVLVFGVSPGLNGYTAVQARALFERLEEELGTLPGVTGVGGARVAILIGDNWGNDVSPEGFEGGPDADRLSNYNLIGPNYFSTLGTRMKAGRDFTRSDTAGQPKVAIVNEEFARKFKLGPNPVGKRMKSGQGNGPFDIEIVGLVEDSKYGTVRQKIPLCTLNRIDRVPEFEAFTSTCGRLSIPRKRGLPSQVWLRASIRTCRLKIPQQ